MATMHVIVVSYEKPIALRCFIDSFLLQTNKDWKMYCIYDGPVPDDIQAIRSLYSDPRIAFFNSEMHFGMYGHLNRKMFLEGISGDPNDFILITNADNYYVPRFVEFTMKEAKSDVGVVMCNTVHSHVEYDTHESRMILGGIDMGAFIVRMPIAQEVGFKHVTYPAADGLYAEECAALCVQKRLRVAHIKKCLFIHN